MENSTNRLSHIKGWGIDADPKNEPTYPMKKYTGDDHKRLDWERPTQQKVNIEILHSIERPTVSAVFGTSVPLRGLSGRIRKMAFHYSESQYRHWLPLLIADRVDVVEGMIEDLRNGHVPNIFKEKGWNAAWKYNRKGLVTKVVTGALVTAALVAVLGRKKA